MFGNQPAIKQMGPQKYKDHTHDLLVPQRENTAMATALLVDDNYFSRRVFEFALRWCGFEVLATKCCRDALEVWKKEGSAIDFIICAVVLLYGSGKTFR